jgi:hypothetical protein
LRVVFPQWVAAIFLIVDDNKEDCHAKTGKASRFCSQ